MGTPWHRHILRIALHSLTGAGIFIAVAIPAAVLDGFIRFLDHLGISFFTSTTLAILEHAILLIDAIGVVVYILVSTLRDIRELLDE